MDRQLTAEESELAIKALNDARFSLEDALQYFPKSERPQIEATIDSVEEALAALRLRGIKTV